MFMIVAEGPFPFFSIGRLDISSEQDVNKWKQIHEWVKTSGTPVGVLRAFHFIDDTIMRDEFFKGGQYHFGFKTDHDKDTFIEVMTQAERDFP